MGFSRSDVITRLTMLFADSDFPRWLNSTDETRDAKGNHVILPYGPDERFAVAHDRMAEIGHPVVVVTVESGSIRAFRLEYVASVERDEGTSVLHHDTTMADFAGLVRLGRVTKFDLEAVGESTKEALATEYA
ncbi:hypothetical protein P9139_17950 [Curtobacterium flaccumfaciens]|nr:hypothetical protein P9139_17950 [Curtobacterium flaccumfaciens]